MAITKDKIKPVRQLDGAFLLLVLVILTFGLVMLFSSSYAYAYAQSNDSFLYIKKQGAFAAVGVIAMLIISKIDYHIYRKLAYPIFGFSLVLLILVLIINHGKKIKRWIDLGPFGQFQPSEIAKLAIIFIFAYLISKNYKRIGTFRYGIMPCLLFLGITAVLMILESHLSGTILIMSIGLVMMFVGGVKARWFIILIAMGAAGVVVVLLFGREYMGERITGWLDPFSDIKDATYQVYQSLLTIGSGGLMGVGLGQSKQKHSYLPEPQNDFIFSIVCEEFGLIGATVVIILFILFIYRGFTIAAKAPDKFGMLVAVGITAQIGIQALLNIAVVSNAVPNTGISLPFFSYGGTALLMQLAEMGIVLNISRNASLEKS